MTTTVFSAVAYKLMVLLMTIFYAFTPYAGPATDDVIQASDDANLHVVLWADSQVSNYLPKRTPYFDAACEDLKNAQSDIDALLIAGDIAENGLLCEYEYVSDHLKDSGAENYLMAVGNHDVRMKVYKNTVNTFARFTNSLNENADSELSINALHYTYDINGYRFIVMGTDRTEFEESYFNDEQLAWLDANLKEATADGKPAFVVCHQTLKNTHGLPDTWNSPIESAGSVGDQSDALYEIMNRYPNVFMISGHLHTGIGQYTYEKIGEINSINLPSLTINNKDGEYNDAGIGFTMEVFDDSVVFHARDFAKGIYLPEYDIEIPLV